MGNARHGTIPNFISRALAQKGWTDYRLALATGIDRSRINRIKNRRAHPKMHEALLIARALGANVEELFV